MKKLILALLLISAPAFARNDFSGTIEVVDSESGELKITKTVDEFYSINELKIKRQYFIDEKAQADAAFDAKIEELSDRISEAKNLGVE